MEKSNLSLRNFQVARRNYNDETKCCSKKLRQKHGSIWERKRPV